MCIQVMDANERSYFMKLMTHQETNTEADEDAAIKLEHVLIDPSLLERESRCLSIPLWGSGHFTRCTYIRRNVNTT